MPIMIEQPERNRHATQKLMEAILSLTSNGERVTFLEQPGCGQAKVQALRVMLSRARVKVEKRGKRLRKFTLRSEVYPYTDLSGKRWDCVLMYETRHESHNMLDQLEEMVGTTNVL